MENGGTIAGLFQSRKGIIAGISSGNHPLAGPCPPMGGSGSGLDPMLGNQGLGNLEVRGNLAGVEIVNFKMQGIAEDFCAARLT
jgi:hypothetical protein